MKALKLSVAISTLALIALSLFIVFRLAPEARYRKDLGFSLHAVNGTIAIGNITGAAAGGVQSGDIVLAWNGAPVTAHSTPASLVFQLAPDRPYTLTLQRGGEVTAMTLTPGRIRDPREPRRTIQLAVIATIWAALSLVIIALSPNDWASRWCAAFMLLAAASQFGISLADIDHPVPGLQLAVRSIGFVAFAAYPWHMVCAFLMACALTRDLTRAVTVASAAMITSSALYTLASARRLIALFDLNAAATIADVLVGWQGLLGRIVLASSLVGTIVLLVAGYLRAGAPTYRRRMGWLVAGIAPAALMYIVSAAVSVASRGQPALEPVYERLLTVTLFTALSVPVCFAYALVRHELFGVRVAIRRSIQYALARNALLGMLAIPVLGLAWTVWRDPDVTVRGLLSTGTPNVYLLIAIALSLAMRERLLAAIDRRFFRDVRDRERILAELASQIGRIGSASEAVTLAEHALEATLHPSSVRVWLRDGGAPLPEGFFDADTVSLDDSEQLDQRRAEPVSSAALTVPIVAHGGELIGALLLGAKRSEEPYTAKDRSLLRAIARQIGIVIENAKLRHAVGQERRIRHEVLGRLDRDAVNLMRECPKCGICFDRDIVECPHDGAELIPTLPVERTIDGKYRLERLIGRGGMGAVYDATDVFIGRRVAVKVLRPHVLGSDTSKRRFHREARILGGISHPGIVVVHDYGTLDAGGAFIVMERLEGVTWRWLLQQRDTIPLAELANWIAQLCDALIIAHARGIVHRDLKPENVIIQSAGGKTTVKVLDFGLAKQLDETDTDGLSMAGTVLGTLGYMSPEQLAGRAVDHRADVFAVGVMVFEALTGAKPFNGTTAAQLAIAMQYSLPELPDRVPPAVRQLLARALAYDVDQRTATITEIRHQLVPALLNAAHV